MKGPPQLRSGQVALGLLALSLSKGWRAKQEFQPAGSPVVVVEARVKSLAVALFASVVEAV